MRPTVDQNRGMSSATRRVALWAGVMVVWAGLFGAPSRADAGEPSAGVPPVSGPVVRPFDPPEERWLPGHRGVDLEAQEGVAVVAAADGVVAFVGTIAGVPVVTVRHREGPDGGLRSTYEPVVATVEEGTEVSAGDVIGTLAGGHCLMACLHWGLRDGDTYFDPLSLLGVPRLRLLPMTEAV